MLHTCAVKFDVLRILKKIAKFFESKQGSGLAESSHVFACTCAFLAYASIFFSLFLMWARSFSEKPRIGIRDQQRFNIGPNTNTTGCYILRAWGPA